MNKKLIALAIAGAFAVPLAANADTSNVVIYGEMAVSVDNVDGGGGSLPPPASGSPASADNRTRISSNNSFLGFKGAEDMGNGLNAIWQFENQVALDIGGLSGVRNSFLGLAGKEWGSVTLGKQDTPHKTSTGKLDVFGQHTLADYRSLFGAKILDVPTVLGPPVVPAVAFGITQSERASNSILYTSPNMSGFTAKAMWAAKNESGVASGATKGQLYSVSGVYENGPIYGALAYEKEKNGAAAGAYEDGKKARVGFGYSFGDFKLGLAYENYKGTVQAAAPATTNTTAKRNDWYVSGAWAMGPNTLKLAYTKAGKTKYNNGAPDADGANQVSLGFSHNMSKRTEVFALYTRVANSGTATYSLGGGATGIDAVTASGPGEDPRGFQVGMVHKF